MIWIDQGVLIGSDSQYKAIESGKMNESSARAIGFSIYKNFVGF